MTFLDELAVQRWDDHRYYHHSRVNQSLHLLSALAFLCAYALLFKRPAVASLIGWLVAMPLRQSGHFFFEPKGYDEANQATHEYKEHVKVGYNLHRKVVLMLIWTLSPLVLVWSPTLLGALEQRAGWLGFVTNTSLLWLLLGAVAVAFRTVQLFFVRNIQAGLVWFTKIMTDPFHDVALYYKSPVHLFRGELFDPIVGRDAA